ncbi:thiamine ABC transporter substrate binding subunit [Arsenicitalea aurantiaca]|uniref:Thiamine-binding periplasmic protein n=1 Tax=Arsenicitalea aurantiaca TaxID=1783274 RepID=A0A433XKU6_9HYPH|nr:thiamine ABC transporter substrate binding subunit [Arsenicitalea aurantiaca]RUT34699.1 thiamine ABC transporter substrate binding subunit [Arsenicitalea aurantiaca]
MLDLTRTTLAVAFTLAGGAYAVAQDLPRLTVYTYDSFASEWGPGPALKAGFEAQCTCTIDFLGTDDAIAVLRRVQLEGAATEADVVVGLDTAIAGEARATGLFAEHGLDLSGLVLPSEWTDAQFVPFDYGYFAYVYNTEALPEPPTSFEELIALPDDFKIVVQDPRSSTPGLGHLLWIEAAYGERAPEIWAGLAPHILTMTRGWSEAYNLFLSGEADMVLSYTTSPAYHAVAEDDDRFAYAEFSEGHLPQVEVAGILASSDQQDLARDFLAYLTSPEGQAEIPTTNWMYPVVDLGDALPEAFTAQAQPETILALDEDAVTANSRLWIEQALAAIR